MKKSGFALLFFVLGFAAIVFVVPSLVTSYSPIVYAAGPDEKQQLIKLEEKWNALSQQKNADALSPMLTEDYLYVSTEGEVGDKALLLKHMREGEPGEPKYHSYRIDQIHARISGTMGVVTGRWIGQGTDKDPSAVAQERWTDVWLNDSGQWKCMASQSTTIPGK